MPRRVAVARHVADARPPAPPATSPGRQRLRRRRGSSPASGVTQAGDGVGELVLAASRRARRGRRTRRRATAKLDVVDRAGDREPRTSSRPARGPRRAGRPRSAPAGARAASPTMAATTPVLRHLGDRRSATTAPSRSTVTLLADLVDLLEVVRDVQERHAALPAARAMRSNSRAISRASSWAVGSSRMMKRVPWRSARAISTIWRCSTVRSAASERRRRPRAPHSASTLAPRRRSARQRIQPAARSAGR